MTEMRPLDTHSTVYTGKTMPLALPLHLQQVRAMMNEQKWET